jgi:hypothetical protein
MGGIKGFPSVGLSYRLFRNKRENRVDYVSIPLVGRTDHAA